jgi:hypothetical protein
MAKLRVNWNRIIGARSLIQSGFYSDPEIRPAILDRCVTRILREQTASDPAEPPVAQDGCEDAVPSAP